LAGAYVDRWNKKSVLIATNIIRALLLVLLAFYLNNLVMIYLISFIVSIFTQFFIPAEIPIIPLVVHKKNLLSANALFGLAIFVSILIAYVLAGPLIIYLKPVRTLFFLAVMFIIGAIFVYNIKVGSTIYRASGKLEGKPNVLKDIRKTLGIMSQTKAIYRSIFLLSLSQILVLVVATIAPGYATSVLGINVEEFPLLFVAPAALGMMIGAVSIANFFHSHPREKVINTGIFLSGISMLLLPYGSRVASRDFIHVLNTYLPHFLEINILHIMTVIAFILGVANSLVFVPANTILQEKTTDEFRGKIYGFLNTAVGVLSLLPIIIVGGLSDLIGVGWVITGLGISILLIGIVRIFTD
jgi:MFS family permease